MMVKRITGGGNWLNDLRSGPDRIVTIVLAIIFNALKKQEAAFMAIS